MNFKKVLSAFILFMFTLISGTIIYVQSKSFSRHLVKVVNEIGLKIAQVEVSFESFSLSLYPFGVGVNKLELQKKNGNQIIWRSSFEKLGYYAGLFEGEDHKIFYGKIYGRNGFLQFSGNNQGNSNDLSQRSLDKKEINRIVQQVFNYQEIIPFQLDLIDFQNIFIQLQENKNDLKLDLAKLRILKNKDDFDVQLYAQNIDQSYIYLQGLNRGIFDGIELKIRITPKKISIEKLFLRQDVHLAKFQGVIHHWIRGREAEGEISGETFIFLKNLIQSTPSIRKYDFKDGRYYGIYQIKFKNKNLTLQSDFEFSEIDSQFIQVNKIKGQLQFENSILSLAKLEASHEDESLFLKKSLNLYDFKKNENLFSQASFELNDFSLNRGLMFLGEEFKILQGQLSGELSVEFKDHHLKILPVSTFSVKEFSLMTGGFHILQIDQFNLSQTVFTIDLTKSSLNIESELRFPHSQLKVKGFIDDGKISFELPETILDLSDFKNISSLGLNGRGPLSLNVHGSIDDTILDFEGSLKNFEVLGYFLGDTEEKLSIDLKKGIVRIDRFSANVNNSALVGSGFVNFNNESLSLKINSQNMIYTNLKKILHPIFEPLTFLPRDLEFEATVNTHIHGKYTFADLLVDTTSDLKNITLWKETLDKGKISVQLKKEKLFFKDIFFQKSMGKFFGQFSYDFSGSSYDFDSNWENIDFQQLNFSKLLSLHLSAKLQGFVRGKGYMDNPQLTFEAYARKSNSGSFKYKDSFLKFKIQKKELSGLMHIFGDVAKTHFSFPVDFKGASQLKIEAKSNNLKSLLVPFLGRQIENEKIVGSLSLLTEVKFNQFFEDLDFDFHLKNINLIHPGFKLEYLNEASQFQIKNNVVKKWDLNINQDDVYVETQGNGIIDDQFSLKNKLSINAKLAQILFPFVLSSDGVLASESLLKRENDEISFYAVTKGKNITLSLDKVPSSISNFDFDVELFDNRLMINKMLFDLDKGSFEAKGDVFFDDFEPDINLKFFIKNADVPILGQSKINIDGEGVVLGNQLPYTLSGDISLQSGELINELNEFSKRSSSFGQIRFMPLNQESIWGKLIQLDVGVQTVTPLKVTNSLMGLAINGDVRLTGDPLRPRCEGKLSIPSGTSSVYFKNNEYILLNGDIMFDPKKDMMNPNFDIRAMTTISNYKIYPKFYGDLERFNFDLSSEPPLPRDSILSLIAFGYTNELQGSLYAKDQQSLTQVGVGSFIFDRFKVSDILNKQFGLQINLGTVIEQSSSESLLSGRTQESGGGVGRTRSATKIELKKKLDEEVTLSVSSTMGGSIGQRQSMNLNYGISENIQVEGVYELRTNEEGDSDIIYNSIGGDLKFRRTFK